MRETFAFLFLFQLTKLLTFLAMTDALLNSRSIQLA